MDLTHMTTADLVAELKRREDEQRAQERAARIHARVTAAPPPIGFWQAFTSEGEDGSGRRDLGVHYGHVVDVVGKLAQFERFGLTLVPARGPTADRAVKLDLSAVFVGWSAMAEGDRYALGKAWMFQVDPRNTAASFSRDGLLVVLGMAVRP